MPAWIAADRPENDRPSVCQKVYCIKDRTMESIESMLKELGTVTIRYAAGMYQADSGCALARGEAAAATTVEGAVRNVLDLKRLYEVHYDLSPTLPIGATGEIPTAGQD